MTLFDHLDNLTHTKDRPYSSLSEQERKTVSIYMINRFVSMDYDLCRLANWIQFKLQNDVEKSYNAYMALYPKANQKVFFKYLKRSKSIFEPDRDLVTLTMGVFQCSANEAIDHLELMVHEGTVDEFIIDLGKKDELKKWKKTLK